MNGDAPYFLEPSLRQDANVWKKRASRNGRVE
jgi:hypothetical protein